MKKVLFLISTLLLSINPKYVLCQDSIDYPVSISYVEGTVSENTDNTFTLLSGSKWLKKSYALLLSTNDIFIIITSEEGNGIAYSDGSEFNVEYLKGNVNVKTGTLNLVTKSMSDGAVLKMADGSLWEVDSYDQYDTGYWLPPYPVIITDDELYMINFKKGKKIWINRVEE